MPPTKSPLQPVAQVLPRRSDDDAPADRIIKRTLLIGSAVLLLLGLLLFDPPGKVAVTIIVLLVLQGLWRGSSDIAGMLVGTLFAVVLARPLAPAFEGITGSIFGVSGLANRLAATFTAGTIVLLVVAAVVSTLLRKLIKSQPAWARWDPYAGATVGAIEGAILALAVMWVPVALRPVAAAQIAQAKADALIDPANGSGQASPQARFVVSAADAIENSALAGVAEATNPVKGTRLISVSGDMLEVLHNDAMRQHFLESEVMRQVDTMESVKHALEIIQADTELMKVLDDGASEDAVRTLFNSDTVMRAIDKTGVVSELADMAPRIADAIEAARKSANEPKPPKQRPKAK
jgi:uncharacterized membrane protein required for colicin V production